MSPPLLFAKFDPSLTNLALVIQALDSHQVRVQALVVAQDSLNTLFQLKKGQKVAAIEWFSDLLLALALTSGVVLIYSPAENQIVRELQLTTSMAIADLHFSSVTHTAWCVDTNGTLCEWDVHSYTLIQQFSLSELLDTTESVTKLSTVLHNSEPALLVGTHSVYLVDVVGRQVVAQFPGHVQPVIAIEPAKYDADLFLTAAEGDRFINVYSISKNATRSVLVASSSIRQMTLAGSADLSVVAIVTETGSLEIFKDPLSFDVQPLEVSSKKKRKQLAGAKSKHCDATIQYARPADEIRNPADQSLFICAVTATHTHLHVTWLENDSLCRFDAVAWTDGDSFTLLGHKTITKAKQNIMAATHTVQGHDVAAPRLYSEQHTVITDGGMFQDELENLGDDDDETLAERLEKITGESTRKNGVSKKRLQKHTAGSLTVVLSQALRNNDNALLETVLINRDPTIVQSTISRLDSSLAVILIDRLAEKLTRQQQRFDQMNFWLKWIIIIHGGVLSSLPNVSHKLANLHSVLNKKASKLPRLLELQGRMSMLEQQNSLKKEILRGVDLQGEDSAEDDVEYIEEIDDAVEAGVLEEEEDEDDDDDEIDENGVDDFDMSDVEEDEE
ncbi:hypothetical protein PUMCH_001552 [Australozyma saopauloensis]|uniref:Small-subunit processome Utp12 domain-containing protein n=1 Tax=Australozyma saopauloensis TaxID=291208 RepID=A0AAX4H7B2_9ASCO|nr:hypothetical protein PUMCH_001552 [[Candida] saopauloensis]